MIGRVLKLPLEDATIKPNYDEAEAGHSIIPDPYACLLEWQRRGHMPGGGLDTVFHKRIMAYMAVPKSRWCYSVRGRKAMVTTDTRSR